MTPPPKALLVILDGLGLAKDPSVSAVDIADTPCLDDLFKHSPNSRLSASGEDVGLPDGQFGNSEVGHLNIGAGRIVWQELSRVNNDIREGTFFKNPVLVDAFNKAASRGKVHLMGLFSDGGVHSHINHLFALLEMSKSHGVKKSFVHAFTDGRDTSPHGGQQYCREFLKRTDEIGTGELASVVGRYFAMDRDNRWERTERAYRLLLDGEGRNGFAAGSGDQPADETETGSGTKPGTNGKQEAVNPERLFAQSYESGTTDEFLEPHLVSKDPESRIESGDVVIFFNIRGDRARQLTKALHQFDEVPFETRDLNLHYVTFTAYDEQFDSFARVAYPPAELKNTLGKTVSKLGLRQLRIAETEKYPHVTYFLNGGEEKPDAGENRILVPSPKVATYDLQPEMSAPEVTRKLIEEIDRESFDLGIVNYANPDMVGHTGVMEAAVAAVECVDRELKKVLEAAGAHGYPVLVIADHGNADCMKQPDGSPHTAHTDALVPAILIGRPKARMNDGILADVAPTLLKLMGLEQPEEMTGEPLF